MSTNTTPSTTRSAGALRHAVVALNLLNALAQIQARYTAALLRVDEERA